MLKLLGKIPHKVGLALSGGVDSMVVLHFLKQCPEREIVCHFVHHRTKTSNDALAFLSKLDIDLNVHYINSEQPKGTSLEQFWRNERYKVFHSLPYPVITCHHLDDQLETWLFTVVRNGQVPIYIPYQNKNVIRPFLLVKKEQILSYAKDKKLIWCEDESNKDLQYSRNRIRHNIVPEVLMINPGIYKILSEEIQANFKKYHGGVAQ